MELVARSTGPLNLEELSQSARAIVRSFQNEYSPEDIKEVWEKLRIENI